MKIKNRVYNDYSRYKTEFQNALPFPHIVVDNFLEETLAEEIAKEFPDIDDNIWYQYNNAIENKKTYNHWERFSKHTYQLLFYLSSPKYVETVQQLFDDIVLYADIGLNGGGWHIHGPGGKLNVHLDYSIHPKLELERRLNLILYLNRDWQKEWGGELGLYSHDETNNSPGKLEKKIMPKFNRAVIFDTTCNSWHGLPEPIRCPPEKARKSIAIYYVSEPRETTNSRGKALFAPHKEQKNDKEVLKLIRKRSGASTAEQTYRDKDK